MKEFKHQYIWATLFLDPEEELEKQTKKQNQ